MSFASAKTRAQYGMSAPLVDLEVHLSGGLPRFSMVGLPEAAVRESKDRIRSALINSGFRFPEKRITVNLAPADLPKDGGRYDLGIALCILKASEQISIDLNNFECFAELSLSGALRGVSGILPSALASKESKRALLISKENEAEVSLASVPFMTATSLKEAILKLQKGTMDLPQKRNPTNFGALDFFDVKGNAQAKRALCIAASGGHHLLMIGPPGTGKSMMASRLPSILPELTEEEALEVASLYSVSTEGFSEHLWQTRPFRSPHHTISGAALVGGGAKIRPGEISLSHRGVLFLDELGEFSPKTLDLLRQPLESGEVHIARALSRVSYPSRFQLIGAMNPMQLKKKHQDYLSQEDYKRFAHRLSAPLVDRIDIHIELQKQDASSMSRKTPPSEGSKILREKVSFALQKGRERAQKSNALLSPMEIERDCVLSDSSKKLLHEVMESLSFSPRVYHRVLKVSRSIADFEDSIDIKEAHLAEAISYRFLDRFQVS